MTKKIDLEQRGILPGYASGDYEPRRQYDRSDFVDHSLRRDNRISVRISGRDLEALKKLAMNEGIPCQSLVAAIIRKYLEGSLREVSEPPSPPIEQD
jgi:hypothetical protein